MIYLCSKCTLQINNQISNFRTSPLNLKISNIITSFSTTTINWPDILSHQTADPQSRFYKKPVIRWLCYTLNKNQQYPSSRSKTEISNVYLHPFIFHNCIPSMGSLWAWGLSGSTGHQSGDPWDRMSVYCKLHTTSNLDTPVCLIAGCFWTRIPGGNKQIPYTERDSTPQPWRLETTLLRAESMCHDFLSVENYGKKIISEI